MARISTLLLCLLTLLTGCASPGQFDYSRDVGSYTPLRVAKEKGEVTVVWRFGTPEWVHQMCQWKPGETRVHGCAVLDEAAGRCAIFLVAPQHFQDVDRLAVVGHEMWHCFGAKHA